MGAIQSLFGWLAGTALGDVDYERVVVAAAAGSSLAVADRYDAYGQYVHGADCSTSDDGGAGGGDGVGVGDVSVACGVSVDAGVGAAHGVGVGGVSGACGAGAAAVSNADEGRSCAAGNDDDDDGDGASERVQADINNRGTGE